LAKRIFPSVAAVLLVLVAIWPQLQKELEQVRFALPRLDPQEAQDLRMVNARYTGLDRQNRPFVITADVARQNRRADDLVSLEGFRIRDRGDIIIFTGKSHLELVPHEKEDVAK